MDLPIQCTRWYLPLLLLPLPTAPAYFLVLFLFTLTLHAQPCFYCICLLTALFLSSCSRHPVPLSAPMSSSPTLGEAPATTFADALRALMPDLDARLAAADVPLPASLELCDRCFVDFAGSESVFEPFNVTRWEWRSVEQLKADLERREREYWERVRSEAGEDGSPTELDRAAPDDGTGATAARTRSGTWRGAFSWLKGSSIGQPVPGGEPSPAPREAAAPSDATREPAQKLPWLRKEYDLRPFGFDIILDFGWSRTLDT
ncbi:hypothetical protein PUNSTDRAFT_139978 [Punctularia strigosozonata HHB-11173 SS5]|uniref:uncharacterized protein n=1 Tax=Punctularia strigosozonata (strain HHB-11173) TaxID=741275 RepID=UPI000441743B|nr:uncharacterized protein PUNSTDRAFT_139978 [Punctularia strigosozonata HHB-11173 SS5]EIN13434.1 hypothetical protein PUNSTDRAFT_139978 [Punctularia strigosozonata HHB-11173 SS5]